MSIEIIERKKSIVVQNKRAKRRQVMTLNPAELATLARWVIRKGIELVPPFVITVELPYSDFGEGDQTTEAYHWDVIAGNRKLADAVVQAVNAELALTDDFLTSKAIIQFVPEASNILMEQLDKLTDVSQAVQSLRLVLLTHTSDSVANDAGYWSMFGFAEDEVSTIVTSNLNDSANNTVEYVLQALVNSGIEKTSLLYRRMKVWASGANIDMVRSVKETK